MAICAGMAGIVDYTNYDDMKYAVSYFLDGLTSTFGYCLMLTVCFGFYVPVVIFFNDL